jgi:hypothetical protein
MTNDKWEANRGNLWLHLYAPSPRKSTTPPLPTFGFSWIRCPEAEIIAALAPVD